jgi:hypothetical protein
VLKDLQTWLFWRSIRRRIKARGWLIIHIGGDGSEGPVWAYSVGLWEWANAPELMVAGHDEVWSNGLIGHAQQLLREGQLVLTDMLQWDIEEFSGIWRRVDPVQVTDTEWFTCARRYKRERTGDETFDAYQLFVADAAGKYPWEDGFDESIRHIQPEPIGQRR